MTRKTVIITTITCDICGKEYKDETFIKQFRQGDKNCRMYFELCQDCMVTCLDKFFEGQYVGSWENIKYKFDIKV